MQFFFLCVSVGTALLLASSYSQSEPYDRSVFDLLLSIGASAGAICLAHRYYPSIFAVTKDRKGRFDSIPLEELNTLSLSLQKDDTALGTGANGARKHVVLIQIAIAALTVRIELYRRISEVAQCTSRSWEVWIPLLLAINEYRYHQDVQTHVETETGSTSRYAKGFRLLSRLLNSPWRYVPSAFVLSYACYSVAALWLSQNSSFICPLGSGEVWSIPRLQAYAAGIDCLIAIVLQEIANSKSTPSHRLLTMPSSYAVILLGAVFSWSLYAVGLYVLKRDQMQWIFINDTPSLLRPIWLALARSCIHGVFVVSSIHYVINNGAYHLSVALTASTTIFLAIQSLYSVQYTYPPVTSNTSVWAFLFIYLGAWSSFRISQSPGQNQNFRTSSWQVLFFLGLLVLVIPRFWVTRYLYLHPIDNLMFVAKQDHEWYKEYASKSTDIQSAVAIYRERYGDHPPPGFDIWYQYARNRSVLIMDDYDQIRRDLLPFRSIAPADIRRQTWEAVSNPWNEISGITIRNGRADVQENVLPTHRWMLEGVAVLINSFAQYLPDMDLAFNLNDESRVTVPNKDITWLRNTATQHMFGGRSSWSAGRASTWPQMATEDYDKTIFENWSFKTNFQTFGSIGCPPDSLSKTHPYLSSQSQLCLQCSRPHTLGQFVSNWTLAADICHQPDMSHLHGLYLSPAAFKTAHQLIPIFSQSKAGGYNDILYPSAWNYMDKVIYAPTNATGEPGSEGYKPAYPDPSFADKENILYWRGATSEGVSAGLHSWRGMNRQRLVHLVNNATSDRDHDYTTILLPRPRHPDAYIYHTISGNGLVSLGLQQMTDIKIADHIARCGGVDCTDQEREFGLVNPVDFQAHWTYRFLFDMDGAGFSGRFLPFLQSRSLPFKTALFREWYDSRITAWRHFVPIDMRLHGLWSTLAYFSGVDGVWPGTTKKYKWDAHVQQGEFIAEEGRKWANTVLRKEDMEVYFFRLLLEWGRLTDDRRDDLGFVIG